MDEELAAELIERVGRDQAARMSLRPGHGSAEWEAVVAPVDRENAARLREIVSQYGWPGHRVAGAAGAHAAWLLAQHAPPDLQEECLPLLQDAVARDDASPADLAYLMDRVLMHRGKPQIHGTQYQVRDGVLELWTVNDPGRLDQRRAALGLEPEAENRARLLGFEPGQRRLSQAAALSKLQGGSSLLRTRGNFRVAVARVYWDLSWATFQRRAFRRPADLGFRVSGGPWLRTNP